MLSIPTKRLWEWWNSHNLFGDFIFATIVSHNQILLSGGAGAPTIETGCFSRAADAKKNSLKIIDFITPDFLIKKPPPSKK